MSLGWSVKFRAYFDEKHLIYMQRYVAVSGNRQGCKGRKIFISLQMSELFTSDRVGFYVQ